MSDRIYKVFISYSWSSADHEQWVVNLAERLMADGIQVTLDKWDLKEGHDLYSFMEKMVKSHETDRVLVILDEIYAQKANERKGGVGTETQIISPEIYSDVSQEKFIPVLATRDENGNPFQPTFLKSRVYIDLSEQEHFENNYEQLLRNIFKRPSLTKPKLGRPPSYLFQDSPVSNRTSTILRSFDSAIERNPNRVNSILKDFLDEFYDSLKSFEIEFQTREPLEAGKQIIDSINQFKPIRDDFIELLVKISKGGFNSIIEYEVITKFFEKLPKLTSPSSRSSWSNFEYDNFRFIISELFLYLVAVPLKYGNYQLLEEILYSGYLIKDSRNYKKEFKNYGEFYYQIDSINQYYNHTFSQNYISPMAEFLISRVPDRFEKEDIVEGDLLCYHIGQLNEIRWFPKTYIYKNEDSTFDFFHRLISARHFEKVKKILGVETSKELSDKLVELREKDDKMSRRGYSNSWNSIIPMWSMIDPELIAKKR